LLGFCAAAGEGFVRQKGCWCIWGRGIRLVPLSHHHFKDAVNEGTLKHTVDSVIKEGAEKHGGVGVGGDFGISGLWWQQQLGIVGFVSCQSSV
jgi:hypothetical protein